MWSEPQSHPSVLMSGWSMADKPVAPKYLSEGNIVQNDALHRNTAPETAQVLRDSLRNMFSVLIKTASHTSSRGAERLQDAIMFIIIRSCSNCSGRQVHKGEIKALTNCNN